MRVIGKVPPESWNRLGRKIIPKLRSGSEPEVDVEFRTTVRGDLAASLEADIRQILEDLELTDHLRIE